MNGHHYIGKHSDDERQLIPNSPIFSASFGAERVFRIRDKADGSIVRDVVMTDNSFVLMGPGMQKRFTHQVPKITGNKGAATPARINVIFRMS